MHKLLHSPILLAVITFSIVALIIVIVDVIRYFGYYFHSHWTEATWTDDLTDAGQSGKMSDDAERSRSKVVVKK